MFTNLLLVLALIVNPGPKAVLGTSDVTLSSRSFSMEDRYNVPSVNQVFKDNILLGLKYMDGEVKSKADVSWPEVEKPFEASFTLNPGEEFAFTSHTLPDYSKNVVKTMNTDFMWNEGYKSDGFLVGDGVCHLASLVYWAAKDAGLTAYAPSNHNFAKINDVPREFGVAIMSPSPLGNLYIINNKEKPVTFEFNFDGTNLTIDVKMVSSQIT